MSSDEHFDYDYMYDQISRAIAKISGSKRQQYFQWVDPKCTDTIPTMPSIQSIPGPNKLSKTVITLPHWSNEHTFKEDTPISPKQNSPEPIIREVVKPELRRSDAARPEPIIRKPFRHDADRAFFNDFRALPPGIAVR